MKYPLAIVNKLIDVFSPDLAMGYDIGCCFKSTLNNALGEKAQLNRHTCLVGAFHGHAHNWLCQLNFLTTYVEELGLEDLEGCKHFFSKSNALASSTRYSSTFHRHQAIVEYSKHNDTFETYANLSKSIPAFITCHSLSDCHWIGTFLLNNYKQALALLETKSAVKSALRKVGARDELVVEEWLKEEEEYLQWISKEPLLKTLEMEYYKLLVTLRDSEYVFGPLVIKISANTLIGVNSQLPFPYGPT
jgi:hypothetical protein